MPVLYGDEQHFYPSVPMRARAGVGTLRGCSYLDTGQRHEVWIDEYQTFVIDTPGTLDRGSISVYDQWLEAQVLGW